MDDGIRFNIEIQDTLTAALARLQHFQRRKLLHAMGASLYQYAAGSHRHPDKRMEAWANRKKDGEPSKLISDRKGGNTALSRSWKLEANAKEAIVSNSRDYGIYHQTGTPKMPRRPMLPIDADEKTPRSIFHETRRFLYAKARSA